MFKFLKFLLHLNNLLFVIAFILILIKINENSFDVLSQQSSEVSNITSNRGKVKKINREFEVNYEVSGFTPQYLSDGITDVPSQNQIDRFQKGNLLTVPVPINYELNRKASKLYLQGELEFEAIPDINMPLNYVCQNDDVMGCFNQVTSLSVFSSAVSTKLLQNFSNTTSANQGENLMLKFVAFVIKAFENIDKGLGVILVEAGIVDDQRKAVGIISYWGNDNFQNIVPISYGGRKSNVLFTKTETDRIGVNISENSFATDLSNMISLDTELLVKRPAIGVALTFGRIDYIGLYDIYDPFSQFITEEEMNKFSNIIFRSIADLIYKTTGLGIGDVSKLSVNKIAHEIPIRAVNGSGFNFDLAFDLVAAVQKYHSGLPLFPNPYGKHQPEYFIDPVTKKRTPNPIYQKWLNYENLPVGVKKALTFIDTNSDNKNIAKDCALQMAEDPSIGCDDLSVEESGFTLDIRERGFPLGLTFTSWNAIFNQLNTNLNGPYINPLSVSLCGRLDLAFNISAGESYMYRVSPSKEMKNPYSGSGTRGTVINSYCVVGAGLANFAKSLMAQAAYLGPRIQHIGRLPLDIQSLTCEKKEQYLYNSAIYVYRNLSYSKFDDVSYLAAVAFNEPNSKKQRANICRDGECKVYTALSFNVVKGNDSYALQGFPTNEHSVLFTYAAPENDVQLIIDKSTIDRKPKYLFFTGSNYIHPSVSSAEFNLRRLLCKLIPYAQNQSQNTKSNCIFVSEPSWGFPKGAALTKVPVSIDGSSITFLYDLLILLYEEDNYFKYKFILVDPDDFSKNVILGNEQGYVLSASNEYDISAIQDNFGSLVLSLKTKTSIKVVLLTYENLNIVIDSEGKLKVNSFNPKLVNVTQNLCSGSNICSFYSDKELGPLKLFVDENNMLHVAGLTQGVGFVFQVNLFYQDQQVKPIIFSYVSKHGNRNDNYDEISAFRYQPSFQEYYIFTSRAGYFLHLFPIHNIKNVKLPENACKDLTCYATIQQFFDPEQFLTDFSNYEGKEDANGNKLEPIGWPIIKDFDLLPNGDIIGVYSYKSLPNLLILSNDVTYSFRGVYTKLTNNSNEVSNVYIPSQSSLEPIPFRYFNYEDNGLVINRDVMEKPDGTFREVISFSLFAQPSSDLVDRLNFVFKGYDAENRREYFKCLVEYAKLKNSIDPFSFLADLLPVPLNNPIIIEQPQQGAETDGSNQESSPGNQPDNNANSDSGYSSLNIGKYCEEKWCVPDSFKLVFNPKYFLKGVNSFNKEQSVQSGRTPNFALIPESQHVQKLIDYLSNRRRERSSLYARYVPYICYVASERGIPCSLLIAIWIQETGAAFTNDAFGCFEPTLMTFEGQVICAANSVMNGFREYYGIGVSQNRIRKGSGNRPGFKTLPEFVPGQCEAGTAFSYMMHRYTPIDQRINVDNQCNRGLILRNSNLRIEYCANQGRSDSFKLFNGIARIPPGGWGEALDTRPNLRFVLETVNNMIPVQDRIPITDSCFPAASTSPSTNTSDSSNSSMMVGSPGVITLDLTKWGTTTRSYGSISVAFAANRLEYGDTVTPKEPFGEGGVDINGKPGVKRQIIIPPGQFFSYNDRIGNSANLPNFIKDTASNNGGIVGAGWCDLATGIRLAAEKVIGPNLLMLKSEFVDSKKARNGLGLVNELKLPHGTGYGYGGNGDIFHWTHSNPGDVSKGFYQNLLYPPKTSISNEDANKFVSIFTRPDTKNDGDLIIRNPSHEYNLVLDVDYDSNNKRVTITFFFAHPSARNNTNNNRQ